MRVSKTSRICRRSRYPCICFSSEAITLCGLSRFRELHHVIVDCHGYVAPSTLCRILSRQFKKKFPKDNNAFAEDHAIISDGSTLKEFANSFGVDYLHWLPYPGLKQPWAEISELRWSFNSRPAVPRLVQTVVGGASHKPHHAESVFEFKPSVASTVALSQLMRHLKRRYPRNSNYNIASRPVIQ